jgi:RNA polymerase sigma factor (sigma-70 family)
VPEYRPLAMDDATLVAAAVGGDRDAWGAIYDRYADRLHDHCWSILRDEHEAADALHDAFVNAARALPQLRDPARLRPWLYAIARNEAYRRHRARARAVPTDEIGEFGSVTVDLEEGAGAPVDDLRKLVWDAAGGLSADDRVLLDLHLRQGLEGQDLAEAMGISANSAYVKLSRLRDTMERSLGALLVARTGRTDCPDLAQILAGWDGELTPLLRKRVARHVDECEVCGDRKKSMVSPLALFAGIPMAPAPAAIRDRILDDTVAASVASKPPDTLFPGGTPPVPPPAPTAAAGKGGGPPWGWIAGIAAAVALAVGLLFALAGDDDGDVATGDTTTSSTTSSSTTSSSTSSTSSTSTTSSTTSTTLPGAVALSTTDLDLGAGSRGEFSVRNSGGAPLSYSLTTSTPLLGINRRTGTLQPGASHTVVVTLDRGAAPEGPFSGVVQLDASGAGTGAVGVTATIAARPPAIQSVTTDEPFVYFLTTCPATTVTVVFQDEHPQSARLFWESAARSGDGEMQLGSGQASLPLPRPQTPSESFEYWVVVTDSLGAQAESTHTPIATEPGACP